MQLKMNFPGYLCVKIEGANCQKVLSMCSFRNIYLCDVTCSDCNNCKKESELQHSYILKLPWKQYQELQSLCDKTDSQLIILSRHGWLYLQSRMYEHLSFIMGIIICLSLILFMQTRIWDIQVTGNIYYDNPVLIEYLATQNVIPGISKNRVSCIELADKIRQEFPKIKWTSVELDGCNLIVHLKENLHLGMEANLTNDEEIILEQDRTTSNESQNMNAGESEISMESAESIDLVSEKDGIIKSIFVRSGIANVKEGDTCKKGDILVKGQIPIYNDAQEIVRYDYVEADADIVVQYDYHYYDEKERNIDEKVLIKTDKSAFFQIFDYYFSLNKFMAKTDTEKNGNSDTSYYENNKNNISKEHLKNASQLKITPTLTLPIYFGSTTTYEYETISRFLTENETKELLEEEIFYFCDDLEKKGVQIYKNNVKMYISDAKGTALGKVTVFENVGEKKPYVPETDESNSDTGNADEESAIE